MQHSPGKIYIGTSGWSYADWQGKFYPANLAQRGWFEFYSRHFPTVEINATFYHLPALKTVHGWHDRAPSGFVFAVKGSRFITHLRKLADPGDALRSFFRRMQPLQPNIGAVLWQLPPSLKKDAPLLDQFLRRLPQTYRQAMEFRDPSWLDEEIFELLRRHRVALVAVSSLRMPVELTATADMVYARFHGLAGGARHDYSRPELAPWAAHLREQARAGRMVYAYFNNDVGAKAPANAKLLREMLQDEDL